MSKRARKKEIESGAVVASVGSNKQTVQIDPVIEAEPVNDPVVEAESLKAEEIKSAKKEAGSMDEFYEQYERMSLDEVQYALWLLKGETNDYKDKTDEALRGYNDLLANQVEILKQQKELLDGHEKRISVLETSATENTEQLQNYEERISGVETAVKEIKKSQEEMNNFLKMRSTGDTRVEPEKPEVLPALTSVPAPDVATKPKSAEPAKPAEPKAADDLYFATESGRSARPGFYALAANGRCLSGPYRYTHQAAQASPIGDYLVVECWVNPDGTLGEPLKKEEMSFFLQ